MVKAHHEPKTPIRPECIMEEHRVYLLTFYVYRRDIFYLKSAKIFCRV